MSKKADTEIEVPKKNEKTCFIITPIGDENSLTRRHIDGVNKSVIEPILSEFGYEMDVSHESYSSGSIKSEIIKSIYQSDLVIANLTYQNPNVLYEVAIRHCAGKPIIHIAENVKELPFDINDHRTFGYSNDMTGTIELTKKIKAAIKEIEENPDGANNPVLNSLGETTIINVPTGSVPYEDLFPEMLKSLKILTDKVDLLQRQKESSSKYRSGKITIDPEILLDNKKYTVTSLDLANKNWDEICEIADKGKVVAEKYLLDETQFSGRVNRDIKDKK